MEPFRISMPWGKMAYYCAGGRGNPLIFLHGTGCDSFDWTGVASLMPPEPRLVMLDFRGHGNSTAPSEPFTLGDLATDVIKLTEHLGIRHPILVGHSLGGMVAMAVAREALRLNSLILLEGWTNLKTAAKAFREPRFFGRLDPRLITDIQTKHKRTVAGFKPEAWNYFWQSVQSFDGGEFLESTSLPIYEIYGNLGQIETTRRNLMVPSKPNIEVIWLDDAGHYLLFEKPNEVAEVCRRVSVQSSVMPINK